MNLYDDAWWEAARRKRMAVPMDEVPWYQEVAQILAYTLATLLGGLVVFALFVALVLGGK